MVFYFLRTMRQTTVRKGDFTGLASSYSKNRAGYSASVVRAMLALVDKPTPEIDFVDVGAGTGIFTRMVAGLGTKSTVAIEPNDDMRAHGAADSEAARIVWRNGSGEATGLADASCDLLTMASSFHWVDFERGLCEFHRVLRTGGRFVALWNPRLVEVSPMLADIEAHISRLKPDVRRVSSGRSGVTERLTEMLWTSELVDDVVYLEGRHEVRMSKDRYLGAWRSVNDLQAELGPSLFAEFLAYAERAIGDREHVDTTYVTRAWSARRR
jgi:SAM-dependent methyltransferase